LPELIESVSARLVQRGIAAGPANLVTTSGASQAFDLVCRALFAPGDAVLVEDPGYFVLFAQLRAHHVRLVPVPRTAEGPDLDALESLCRTHRPRAFFVQTLLHNPTGTSISPANCHRLLSIAEKYALALVEDDVYGDLHAGPAVRLAQIDGLRHVIHVGSFSKLVGPAIRVGFVAAEAALVARLVEGKMLATLSGSALLESIVAAVLGSGRYDRHVEDLRGRLARARRDTFAALTSTGIAFEDTAGAGIFLWGRVPENIDMDRLVRRASAQSILLAKGALFSAEGKCGHYLRFNAAYSAAPALASFLTTEIGAAA
jgi:DNA-binding transcriptional MocR family regulator